MMIPIETEKEIRKLLRLGYLYEEIIRQTGVCEETVATIHEMLKLVDKTPLKLERDIKKLSEAKLPIGSIEMRLHVPRGVIYAIRRYHYLDRHEIKVESEIPKEFIPPPLRHVPSGKKLASVNQDLFCIACDIVALDELTIISNPLFHHLAVRAKEILEELPYWRKK